MVALVEPPILLEAPGGGQHLVDVEPRHAGMDDIHVPSFSYFGCSMLS